MEEELETDLTVNTYESVILFHKHHYTESIDKFKDMCSKFSKKWGKKIIFDNLGIRKLAYDIKKEEEAYYIKLIWRGTIKDITELERHLRIDENVLKFITIKLDEAEAEDLEECDEDTTTEDEMAKSEQKLDAWDAIFDFN